MSFAHLPGPFTLSPPSPGVRGVERFHDGEAESLDRLRPARGVVLGLMIAAGFWLAVVTVVLTLILG